LQRIQQPPVLLSFYEALKGKDIITTAEGTNLGKADGAIIDSSTMTLEAVTVAENSVSSPTSGFCIPTATLSQVGDVILVSEERAMRRPPSVPEFVSVLGTHVRSARGIYIGRVKDVDFDPETGAISAIYYDEYGLSWLPLSMQLVNLYGVPTEAVLDVCSGHMHCCVVELLYLRLL
jgi:sporulation protein YlmC with PRC-barrel domain